MCNVSRSNLRTFLKVLPSLNPCDNPSFATNPISKFGFLTIVFCCCKNCKISNILSKIILLRHSGNVEALFLQSFGTFESQQNKMQNYPFKSHLWGLFPSPPPHSFEAEQKMLQKNFLRISIRAATTQTAVLLIVMIFYPTTATLSSFSTNDEKQLNADVRYKRCQQCGQERLDYLFKNWNICISENLPKRINNCHSRFKILPKIK